jgi:hypothetical protein
MFFWGGDGDALVRSTERRNPTGKTRSAKHRARSTAYGILMLMSLDPQPTVLVRVYQVRRQVKSLQLRAAVNEIPKSSRF